MSIGAFTEQAGIYKSVTEQAGIYAGSEGFDINVKGNTALKGAVIDSMAEADKNSLTTGTLTFQDIENSAEYSADGYGINASGSIGGKNTPDGTVKREGKVSPNLTIPTKEDASSTTKSAVADARIHIMQTDKQKQDINKLDRNTADTLNKLGQIFDQKKLEEKQELAGTFQEVWHTAVGDLVSQNQITTNEQKALNILGGAIAAELGGADINAALVGGATTELLQKAFSKIKDPSLRKVAVAVSAAIVAKGTGTEAAANVAKTIQEYNHDYHAIAEAVVSNNPKLQGLKDEEREKFVDDLAEKLEDPTKPDAYKITVSGGARLGASKSYVYDPNSDVAYYGDGTTISGSELRFIVGNPSLSVSVSSLRIVDIGGGNKNIEKDTKIKILTGKSIGISGYFGIGGGVSTPLNGEYSKNTIIVELGFGSPQFGVEIEEIETVKQFTRRRFQEYVNELPTE